MNYLLVFVSLLFITAVVFAVISNTERCIWLSAWQSFPEKSYWRRYRKWDRRLNVSTVLATLLLLLDVTLYMFYYLPHPTAYY